MLKTFNCYGREGVLFFSKIKSTMERNKRILTEKNITGREDKGKEEMFKNSLKLRVGKDQE